MPCPARSSRGATLLEAALVLPVLLLLLLGGAQLVLLTQARLAVRYAAYCAARAGSLGGGEAASMRDAALLVTLPLYAPDVVPARLLERWARVTALARATSALDGGVAQLEQVGGALLHADLTGLAPDLALVRVRALSPTRADFAAAEAWQRVEAEAALRADPGGPLAYPGPGELEADDARFLATRPEAGVLTVEVRVLYPLRVPLAGALIHAAWLAVAPGAARTGGPEESAAELAGLRLLAERAGVRLLPLRGTWAVPLQSSAWRASLPEPAGD